MTSRVYHKTMLVTERGHRLHNDMNRLCILVESISVAIQMNLGKSYDFKQGDSTAFASSVFDQVINMPLFGPVLFALTNRTPDRIEFELAHYAGMPESIPPGQKLVTGLQKVIPMAFSPVFVEFFERHRPWLENDRPSRWDWSPMMNFASVVRNALSHDGKIKIKGKNPAPAQWYHLSYGASDDGKEIISVDIEPADLVLLMFEMSDELDKLGCPISP